MSINKSFYCFVNDTTTTDIYTYRPTLSLHDARPISVALYSGGIPMPSFDVVSELAKHEVTNAVDNATIGRAHVCTPVTHSHLVCRLLLEKKKKNTTYNQSSPL